MGVRPPADDDLDEPDAIEFGIAALDARLSSADLSYPVERETLETRYGDAKIPYDAAGNSVRLSEVLARVETHTFRSERELKNELHPVFEDLRESRSTSLLAQLRSLVPF